MKPTPKRAALTTRALCVSALVALLAAGCGADEPSTLQSVPTTAPTTFDTTKEYAGEDRGQPENSRESSEDAVDPSENSRESSEDAVAPSENSRESSEDAVDPSTRPQRDAPDGGEGEQRDGVTSTDSTNPEGEPRADTIPAMPSNPPPTEDLYPGPSYDSPTAPIQEFGGVTVVIAMPQTASDVVGWTWESPSLDEGYEGSVDMVFDGWSVGHYPIGGDAAAEITLYFTIVGNYSIKDPPLDTLTLLSSYYTGKRESVTAVYWEESSLAAGPEGNGIPVGVEWLDPGLWAPIKPGEDRHLWMQWVVPVSTNRLDVRINDAIYSILPQDPGAWGDITSRPTEIVAASPTTDLMPLCDYRELCDQLGADIDRAILWFDGTPTNSGWKFIMYVNPYPDVRSLSSTDLRLWYEGEDQIYNPRSDPWVFMEANDGQVAIDVKMPTLAVPLYVQMNFPDRRPLVWKTVAPMRETVISGPGWRWNTPQPSWGEAAAVATADHVCWAHWTGSENPANIAEVFLSNWVGEQHFEVTEEMVGWLIEAVCDVSK